ncbi:MAG TPA: hypothetical protein VFP22_10135, partial [Candidatus Limnocylindrales bacterium]|nr:hypothetical protein [Candidatus Limnocylindrales bacterium]
MATTVGASGDRPDAHASSAADAAAASRATAARAAGSMSAAGIGVPGGAAVGDRRRAVLRRAFRHEVSRLRDRRRIA